MPKALAGTDKIPINANGYAFVGESEKWYVRGKGLALKGKGGNNFTQPIKSLKLRYEASKDQEKQVIRLAEPIVEEWIRRSSRDQTAKPGTLASLAKDFLENGEKLTEANEELIARGKDPKWQVEGGQGYWNRTLLSEKRTHWEKYMKPFWADKDKYRGKAVTDITFEDTKDWQLWKDKKFPDLAPSTLNKHNTTLRHLFKLAQRQGEAFQPPTLINPRAKLRERKRPNISFEQMEQVDDYLKETYRKAFAKNEATKYIHYRFLLKHYLDLLKYTGIRPWQTKKNALKMKDIFPANVPGGDGSEFIIERKEKGHEYEAAASRRFIKTYDAVNLFYERFGIGKDREYFFCHPETLSSRIVKGNPIISFKKQWQTLMTYFGWNDDAEEIGKRINFYSYRHSFITNKLDNNPELSIRDIAQATGTSHTMIETIYHHWKAERGYEKVNAKDYDHLDTVEIFSRGLEVGEVEANSKEHWDAWREDPDSVGFEPTGEEE